MLPGFLQGYRRRKESTALSTKEGNGETGEIGNNFPCLEPFPENACSWWSRATFSWLTPVMDCGKVRPLQADDLVTLRPSDDPRDVQKRFYKGWAASLHAREGRTQARDDKIKAIGRLGDKRAAGFPGENDAASLFRALCSEFLPQFLVVVPIRIACDVLNFVGPAALHGVLAFLSEDGGEVSTGLFYALVLLVAPIVQSFLVQSYYHRCFRVGTHVRAAVIALAYRKCLLLSPASRAALTHGELVNIITVDAQRLGPSVFLFLHMIWSAPLQITISLWMLYGVIGRAVLAGLLVMLLLMPVNTALAYRRSARNISLMACKDDRMRAANELLQGVRQIRFLGWEALFMGHVADARIKEMGALTSLQYLEATSQFLWSFTPVMVAVASFVVMALDPSTLLTPERVFSAMALFNALRFPLNMLQDLTSTIAEAYASIGRVQKLLLASEVTGRGTIATASSHQSHLSSPTRTVAVSNGSSRGGNQHGCSHRRQQEQGCHIIGGGCSKHEASSGHHPADGKGDRGVEGGGADGSGEVGHGVIWRGWCCRVWDLWGRLGALSSALRSPTSRGGVGVEHDVSNVPHTHRHLQGDDVQGDRQGAGGRGAGTDGPVAVMQGTAVLYGQDGSPQRSLDILLSGQCFAWEASRTPLLQDICLEVVRGQLVALVGHVGSGKTSLLSALLGDMHLCSPASLRASSSSAPVDFIHGSVAYTSQSAWIMNCSLRDNVLFGMPWDPERYHQVLDACGLQHDIQFLPAGDLTEIGEKGINLSGGQKACLALARAVYSDHHVYLLDDPLSAMDAALGRHVFERVIGPQGLLEGKTRVLATHQVQHLAAADVIVVLENGRIKETGTYTALVAAGLDFATLAALEGGGSEARTYASGVADASTAHLGAGDAGDVGSAGAPGDLQSPDLPRSQEIQDITMSPLPEEGHNDSRDGDEGTRETCQPGGAESPAGAGRSKGRATSAVTEHGDAGGRADMARGGGAGAAPCDEGGSGKNAHQRGDGIDLSSRGGDVGGEIAHDGGCGEKLYRGNESRHDSVVAGCSGDVGGKDAHVTRSSGHHGSGSDASRSGGGALISEEERVTGRVSAHVYVSYLASMGPRVLFGALVAGVVSQGFRVGLDSWMSVWSNGVKSALAREGSALVREGSALVRECMGAVSPRASTVLVQAGGAGERSQCLGDGVGGDGTCSHNPGIIGDGELRSWPPPGELFEAFCEDFEGLGRLGAGACSEGYCTVADRERDCSPIIMDDGASGSGGRLIPTGGMAFVGVYVLLALAAGMCVYLWARLQARAGLSAARVLHDKMLACITRAPMAFFDTNPIGRILNRFSKDQDAVDVRLPTTMANFMNCLLQVGAVSLVTLWVTPGVILPLVPMAFVYLRISSRYMVAIREVKRLESISMSPLLAHYAESISGAPVIRAFGRVEAFVEAHLGHLKHNMAANQYTSASNRWLSLRLDSLGALVVFSAALYAVLLKGHISAGLAGLAISYSLLLTNSLAWMARMGTDVETSLSAVERLLAYTQVPPEAAVSVPEVDPPHDKWPTQGAISFQNVLLSYRPGLPPALNGFTCEIAGGEKIGVVGRVGAGKSSIAAALFRIVELTSGRIVLDGVDIARLGLHTLRSRMGIITQEPLLFCGSVRANVDPLTLHSDDAIWDALTRAGMRDHVASLGGLDSSVAECGSNLSNGQRQMICLARTLVRNTKVVVMDEATASIDLETDDLIGRTVREHMHYCTVITIAHRLHTVLDNDRLLVISGGRAAEFAPPHELMSQPGSMLASLVEEAGPRVEGKLRDIARRISGRAS
eukprot:jgi/Mesvir1/18103/Mv09400-RA.1